MVDLTKAKVIKTIIKTEEENKTVEADAEAYHHAYTARPFYVMKDATPAHVKTAILTLSLETLPAMLNYIKHDRSTSQVKIAGLTSFLAPVRD